MIEGTPEQAAENFKRYDGYDRLGIATERGAGQRLLRPPTPAGSRLENIENQLNHCRSLVMGMHSQLAEITSLLLGRQENLNSPIRPESAPTPKDAPQLTRIDLLTEQISRELNAMTFQIDRLREL